MSDRRRSTGPLVAAVAVVAVACCAAPGLVAGGGGLALGGWLGAHGRWLAAGLTAAAAVAAALLLTRRRSHCRMPRGLLSVRLDGSVDVDPARLGPARTSALTPLERSLYRWILLEMAAGRPVDYATLRARATDLGVDDVAAMRHMAEQDLVHIDEGSSSVRSAYPFSGVPTAHAVRLDGAGVTVNAMCAIDALGIPFMLGQAATVRSRDTLTNATVQVHISPDAEVVWEPPEAVVVAGGTGRDGSAALLACPVINFFESGASAERFIREHRQLRATVLRIPQAIQLGRALFEGALSADGLDR